MIHNPRCSAQPKPLSGGASGVWRVGSEGVTGLRRRSSCWQRRISTSATNVATSSTRRRSGWCAPTIGSSTKTCGSAPSSLARRQEPGSEGSRSSPRSPASDVGGPTAVRSSGQAYPCGGTDAAVRHEPAQRPQRCPKHPPAGPSRPNRPSRASSATRAKSARIEPSGVNVSRRAVRRLRTRGASAPAECQKFCWTRRSTLSLRKLGASAGEGSQPLRRSICRSMRESLTPSNEASQRVVASSWS